MTGAEFQGLAFKLPSNKPPGKTFGQKNFVGQAESRQSKFNRELNRATGKEKSNQKPEIFDSPDGQAVEQQAPIETKRDEVCKTAEQPVLVEEVPGNPSETVQKLVVNMPEVSEVINEETLTPIAADKNRTNADMENRLLLSRDAPPLVVNESLTKVDQENAAGKQDNKGAAFRVVSGVEQVDNSKVVNSNTKEVQVATTENTDKPIARDLEMVSRTQVTVTSDQIEQKAADKTDVKKIIDFENHRLSASKLSSTEESEPETNTGKNDEGSKSLGLTTRLDTVTDKNTSREFNLPEANKLPVNTREFVDQVVKKAELIIKSGASEMKIDLKPEFLGKLTIKIIAEDSGITARFITENSQVKHLLEGNLHTLKQALESQGIKVEKTEVNVQLNNSGMFDGSESERQDLWQQSHSDHSFRESYYSEEYGYNEGLDELAADDSTRKYGFREDGSMNFLI